MDQVAVFGVELSGLESCEWQPHFNLDSVVFALRLFGQRYCSTHLVVVATEGTGTDQLVGNYQSHNPFASIFTMQIV